MNLLSFEMVFGFLFSFLISSVVVTAQFSQVFKHPAAITPILPILATVGDVCDGNGTKAVIVDSANLSQHFQWDIGAVGAQQSPAICKATFPMDYDSSWKYAVTKVKWKGYTSLPAGSEALVTLSWSFDPNFPELAGTTIMSWGLSGPRNRAWVDQSDIAPRNQLWSPCTQIAPLVVEWQVEIGSFGTKQRINTGALGRYEDAGQLSLEIVTEWKQCDGSGGQLPPVMPSPSTSPVTAEPGRGFEPAITPAGTPYIP